MADATLVEPDDVSIRTLQLGNTTLSGKFVQGGMLLGKTVPGAAVSVDGKPLRITPEGDFVFGFGRDAPATATLEVKEPGRKPIKETLRVAQRKYNIQKVEGVPQRTVTPSKESLARIRKETAQVKQARATDSDLTYFLQRFQWPLIGPLTGFYGSQRYYNGEPRRPHYGLDIAAPEGTLVYAPADGVVTLAHPDMFYSGGTLIMDHGYGISSTFIHLSEVLVKKGDKVSQGDPVARVGAGGRATGPHLDWRINWYDVRLDPQLIMPPMVTPPDEKKASAEQ
ncbi:MAG: M23 family metallopeptidase [Ketobacteraceae bacterium]|nr:M23 family metallopeptidase [Ketobacteraceae bacterium]